MSAPASLFLLAVWGSPSSTRSCGAASSTPPATGLNFLGTYIGGLLSVVFFAVLAQFYGNAQPAALAPYGGDYFTFLLIGSAFARFLSLGLRHFGRELEHDLAAGTIEPVMVTATSPGLALIGPRSGSWLRVSCCWRSSSPWAGWPSAPISRAPIGRLRRSSPCSPCWPSAAGACSAPVSCSCSSAPSRLAGWWMSPCSCWPASISRCRSSPGACASSPTCCRSAIRSRRCASPSCAGDTLADLWQYAAVLAGFTLLLFPLGLWGFRRAIDSVRRGGGLGHY